ncbi:MAG TPA: SRPBCC domain-containing protein [Actinomycetota bacterium]|nr:SRPBCC domain-containing protein [Actinomycetota bacterium]
MEREIVLPVPPGEVWRALTDPGRLGAWFGANVELDPRPGGHGRFRFPDGSERAMMVEESDRPRRFAFRWAPFRRRPDGSAEPTEPTRVAFELEEDHGGTRLTVTETVVEASPAGARP